MIQSNVINEFSELLAKIHVLIVDNNEKALALMTEILKKLGFSSLYKAQDGFEAVKLLKSREMDLIITDWELRPLNHDVNNMASDLIQSAQNAILPVDGGNFVKFLRTSKASSNPYIPIIMLTGRASQDSVENARDAGVNEILIKPVSADSLCKRIILTIDDPRAFITSKAYRGPCRRRRIVSLEGRPDRRKLDIKIIRSSAK